MKDIVDAKESWLKKENNAMSDIVKQLKEYYDLKERFKYLSFLKEETGELEFIPFSDDILYFTFGQDVLEDRIDEEAEKGNVIKIKASELYKKYYGWDDEKRLEEYFMEEYGYDKRTKMYLDKFKNEMHYVGIEVGDEKWKLKNAEELDIMLLALYGELGLTNEGLWCYQYSYLKDEDEFVYKKMLFTKKPDIEDIATAVKIEDLEFEFRSGFARLVFRCWECGTMTHWLDVPGDFFLKYHSMHRKECGC